MDKAKKIFFRTWRLGLVTLSLALIAYILYFNRLGTLLPGYSSDELAAYTHASNWHYISTDPINAPYALVVWLATAVLHHGILATRMVAAGFGIVIALTFYAIIRQWYSFRVAFLGTLLFATSSGFLHFARLGTGQVLQMSILAFIAFLVWYQHEHTYHKFVGYGLAATLALLWYIPGMVWFELLGIVVLTRHARMRWSRTPNKHYFGWIAVFLAVLAPLISASIQNTHILLNVAGLPQHLGDATHAISNLRTALLSVSTHGASAPRLWVGRAPLLTAAELILGALGVYGYLYRDRSTRAILLTGMAVLSVVLIALGGGVGLASLVPLLYLFIIHGLRQLLGQWLIVFPRNPIAKLTGVGVICIMLFFSVLYQVRTYFIAWPHTATALQTFNLQQPK